MRWSQRLLWVGLALLLSAMMGGGTAEAHPMPHSVVLLDVHDSEVTASLELPLADLSAALGVDLQSDPDVVVRQRADQITQYLQAHLAPTSTDGEAWAVAFGDLVVTDAEQTSTGPYREVQVSAVLTPPRGADVRHFRLGYDVIVHQVITHTAFVSVRQDWSAGAFGDEPAEVGVVRIDSATGKVKPVTIDLSNGSDWRGFTAMVELGTDHIREGTDHLLFLLTLLLPAPLLVARRRWGGFAGVSSSISAIAKITLAFTIGHSATLVLASIGRWAVPTGPIEALIAVSIFVSALHAVRPIFAGREVLVAGFFGLIHGAAFSFTLAELDLSTPRLLWSLLGFNLGIEIMQLLIVLVVLPSLIVLASRRLLTPIRVTGAVIAAIASLGWLADRLGSPNMVADTADRIGAIGPWVIIGLAVAAVLSVLVRGRTNPRSRSSDDPLDLSDAAAR